MPNSREWNLAAEAMRNQVLKEIQKATTQINGAFNLDVMDVLHETVLRMPMPEQTGAYSG